MKNSVFQLFVMFFVLLNAALFAQGKGTVQGKIYSADEPLPFANVLILGTSYGIAADMEGNYKISNVPAGTYTIQARYVGLIAKEETITITSSSTIELNFDLEASAVDGEEILVTAQARGQIEAINQQLSSNTIVNVVSKAKIQELPDANAAESVGRLPGVSIIRSGGEGSEVAIRGMEPKFNLITINGVRVPSTAINDRSVDLSMFSVDMLDGIELTKAITPDQDADAVGGIVNFQTSKAPEGFNSRIMIQKGYNGHSEGFYPMKLYGGVSNRFFENTLGGYLYANYEQADRSAYQFRGSYDVQGSPLPGEEFVRNINVSEFSLRDVHSEIKRFGLTANLDYDLPFGNIMLLNTYSNWEGDSFTNYNGFDLTHAYQTYRLMRNINKRDLLTNSFQGKLDFSWLKTDFNFSHSYSETDNPTDYYVEFRETSAFSGNVADHIDEGPQAIQSFARNNIEETGLVTLVKQPSHNEEQVFTSSINFTIPFSFGDMISADIKTGAKFRYTYKNADENLYQSNPGIGNSDDPSKGIAAVINAYPDRTFPRTTNGQIQMLQFIDKSKSVESFMDGKYNFGSILNLDEMEEMMRRVTPGSYYTSPRGDLDDNIDYERIAAGYVMSTINIGEDLMVLPGVRYEKEYSNYLGAYVNYLDSGIIFGESSRQDTSATRRNEFWFPMLHIKYKFTNWLDIRFAATKSIVRPDYRYLVPKFFENSVSLSINRGNPQLKPATSQNLDLSFSTHSNTLGLFTVSGFYKEISDMFYPIALTVINKEDAAKLGLGEDKVGYQLTQPVNNIAKVYVRGIELDWQTRFWYLPGFLSGFVLDINYTKMNSVTYYPRTLLVRKNLPSPPWFTLTRVDTSRKGRLIDQPNDVLNCSLGYDYKDFSGRISIIFQGNTLRAVGSRPETDGFTKDLVRYDLSLKQSITENIQAFFNLNNFTNSADLSTEPVKGYETSSSYYDWTADIGIRLIF